MPTGFRKYAILAFAFAAFSLVAAACGSDAPAGDCLSPDGGVLVPSDCEAPGITPDPTATPLPTAGNGNGGGNPGFALFQQFGCSGCHTIDGTPARGAVGPNLTTVGAKGTDYVREAVCDPNATMAPGFMPDIMPQTFCSTIPVAEIDALVEYLSGLQ